MTRPVKRSSGLGITPPCPLRETDNREEFDCGRESLNLWFRRYAWANQAASVSRTSVIAAIPDGQITGFVSLRPRPEITASYGAGILFARKAQKGAHIHTRSSSAVR